MSLLCHLNKRHPALKTPIGGIYVHTASTSTVNAAVQEFARHGFHLVGSPAQGGGFMKNSRKVMMTFQRDSMGEAA